MTFAEQLQRFGLLLPGDRRPTVLIAGTTEEIGRFYAPVDAALKLRPGHRLVLAAGTADIGEVRRRYLHEIVLQLPHPSSLQFWRRRLGAILVVGPPRLAGLAGEARFVDGSRAVAPEELAEMMPPFTLPTQPRPARLRLVDLLCRRRIGSLAALKALLGNPPTIICLGNGPSSEDARLAGFGDATLFRVNWNWRGRGWMTEPSVVFTADPDLPSMRPRPVIVFPTAAAGVPILLGHMLRMRPPSAGYIFLDGFDPLQADFSQPVVPTNGALMIAVAAALQPARIVIAGMDLYQHPDGRYPGDASALDGYSREHSIFVDLALIRAALGSFRGEVTNFSDSLRTALGQDS